MEALLIFIIKSMALLLLFWAGYQLLLQNETFFNANRWYFLAGMFASVVLPLITITKIVWVDPAPEVVSNFNWNEPYAPVSQAPPNTFDWLYWISVGYATGLAVFMLFFFRNFIALQKVIRKPSHNQEGLRYIDSPENNAPFSYLNCIVYNSGQYSQQELEGILEHERTHCREKHSIDVLLLHWYCIIFWFSPIAWLYKKAALQNLEFIADRQATKVLADKKIYQFTMLRVASDWKPQPISNPFYQSLIKKRIVMLNKSQSNQKNSLKYLFILPLLALFVLAFQVEVIAQERKVKHTKTMVKNKTEVVIDKNTSDAQLKIEADRMKKEHGIKLKFSKVKRNNQGEIVGIKAEFNSRDGKKGVTQVSGDEPIAPIRFFRHGDGRIGFGQTNAMRVTKVLDGNDDGQDENNFHLEFDGEDAVAFAIPEIEMEFTDVPPPAALKVLQNLVNDEKTQSRVYINKSGEKPVVMINGEKIAVDDTDINLDGKTFAYSYSSSDNDKNFVIVNGHITQAEAMQKARDAMEKAGPTMEDARKKIEEAMQKRSEAMDKRAEARAKREHSDNRMSNGFIASFASEWEKVQAELEKAREDLEKERKKLEKARLQNK